MHEPSFYNAHTDVNIDNTSTSTWDTLLQTMGIEDRNKETGPKMEQTKAQRKMRQDHNPTASTPIIVGLNP